MNLEEQAKFVEMITYRRPDADGWYRFAADEVTTIDLILGENRPRRRIGWMLTSGSFEALIQALRSRVAAQLLDKITRDAP